MSPVNYARTLLKISVSQMLQTVGFQTAQSTALDILVEILERYIYLLSKTSHEYSEFGKKIFFSKKKKITKTCESFIPILLIRFC